MGRHEIILDENQEKIASLLAKLHGETVDQHCQREMIDYLQQIGQDVIYSYLKEIKKETPTVKEFRDAGITYDEVNKAVEAAKAMGMKYYHALNGNFVYEVLKLI